MPEARLAILRQAFAATVQDSAFLKDAEREKLGIQYVPASVLAALVEQLYATPPDIIEKAKAAREYKSADGKLKAHGNAASAATQTARRLGQTSTPSAKSSR